VAKVSKFLKGWYRVSGEHHFSNVRLERSGEWFVDLRYSHNGDLRQLAGLWNTKREAVEEAERVIARADALFIPQVPA
jgi:hypothetical protein